MDFTVSRNSRFPASTVEKHGQRVTTKDAMGGVGIGFIFGGCVVENLGNGSCGLRSGGLAVTHIIRDGGLAYITSARTLKAPPADAWIAVDPASGGVHA